jgi:hypothetical protein
MFVCTGVQGYTWHRSCNARTATLVDFLHTVGSRPMLRLQQTSRNCRNCTEQQAYKVTSDLCRQSILPQPHLSPRTFPKLSCVMITARGCRQPPQERLQHATLASTTGCKLAAARPTSFHNHIRPHSLFERCSKSNSSCTWTVHAARPSTASATAVSAPKSSAHNM